VRQAPASTERKERRLDDANCTQCATRLGENAHLNWYVSSARNLLVRYSCCSEPEMQHDSFDLQAQADRIALFEEKLKHRRSRALWPNHLGGAFLDQWERQKKQVERDRDREEGQWDEKERVPTDGEKWTKEKGSAWRPIGQQADDRTDRSARDVCQNGWNVR
jgi:hypothetical protein